MHPADFKRLTPTERQAAAWGGAFEGTDWKVERVAHLTGIDPEQLDWHVEAERGWEPHDEGYLHQVVVSARILLTGRAE